MKTIMHVISGDLWAGAQSQVFIFLSEFNKRKTHNLEVIVFNKTELFKRLSIEGIKPHLIDEKRTDSFHILMKLRRLIIDTKPDIIHAHEYKSMILATLANILTRRKARMVRTLHGLTSAPNNIRHVRSSLVLWIDNLFLKHFTDAVVAVSRPIEKILRGLYPQTMIYQINNAVRVYDDPRDSRDRVRAAFGVSRNTFWIGTAARLVPIKNIDMLIEAAKILSLDKKLKFLISVFGDGPMKDGMQERIRAYGLDDVVVLHGHHPDVLSIVRAWDAFVLTSWNEGMPMSLLEAMSFGIIPVCTRVGGVPDIIDDTENGFLVKPGNHDELASVLLQLFHKDQETRGTLQEKARNTIVEKYAIEGSVAKLISLYEDICKGRRDNER